MKKIMKKLACAALTAALVVTSLAVAPDTQAAPKAKKIVMNAKSVKLAVGEKYKLKVKKVKPAKASKKVTYKTTKKAVATVTKKGVIKAKAVGTAKIKVTSKVNKKAKATVKVTVTTPSVVSPSAQPTTPVQNVTPNPTATAPVDTATDVPAATNTPKPTRTPRPTAVPTTPTPEPTQPPMNPPGAPYELPFVLDGDAPNIVPQGDATVEANADGSVKVTVNTQYSGMAFNVPTEMLENNYDTMTVYYKNPVNISTGFGCGLWQDPNNKDTETVAAWGGVFSAADENGNILQEGEYTAALGEGNTKTWYINKALFFFNDADSLSTNGPAQVTITKVVFSNSKYTGEDEPQPTPGSEATASPEPSAEPTAEPPVAVKMSDDAVVTVDGIADEAAYADVTAYDIASRVVCDNKKDSDTTATAKLMWKADALYGFVSVKDADIAKFGNNNYQWDGIELFLDEDNSRDTEWANNTDAFQYRYTGYTKTEEGVANPAAAAIFAGGNSTDYAVEAQYVFTEDGYDVEFKIPFKDAKEIDSVVGFDIIVQDCDSEGRNAEIYMFPTDKTKSYWNLADVFGELTLKDAAAVEEPSEDINVVLSADVAPAKAPNWYMTDPAKNVYNEDGSVSFLLVHNDQNRVNGFYFNADKTAIDLNNYSKIVVRVSSDKDNFKGAAMVITSDTLNADSSVKTTGASFGTADYEITIDLSDIETETAAYGVGIQNQSWLGGEPEPTLTVKSIQVIK